MTAQVFVSAYTVSPAFAAWDPTLEAELLPAICALDGVAGLEIPWTGSLHKFDDAWFLANLPAVKLALTSIPSVMGRIGVDPAYGLASTSDAGRAQALADLARVCADVARLNDESAANVAAVMLHSAPSRNGDAEALTRSLTEIASWDWQGAQLVLEHCDAYVPGQPYAKGFLSVDAELAAIEQSGAPIGSWLNWGRSAIELRDADAVTDQIARVAASGHLVGLAFSGAASVGSPYGDAWVDAHLPIHSTYPESLSLLDDEHVADALTAAGAVSWLGLKVARHPDDVTAADALRTVQRNLAVVQAAR